VYIETEQSARSAPGLDEESRAMILHIAQFTWKPEVTDADVEALTSALMEMAAQIPEIRSYRAAPNLRVRPSATDYACAAIVESADDLAAYLDHPLHKAVYDRHLGRMVAERTAAQLPIESGSLA
jgi:hypothetical protein